MTPRIRHGALLSLPGTLLTGIAAYAAFVVIKRIDGPTTLGYLSLAWVIANIGSSIAALGPSHTALRFIAGPEDSDGVRARFRGMVLVRSCVLGLALAVGGAAISPFSSKLGLVVILSVPWVIGQALVLYESETLKAAHRFGQASAVLALRAVAGWAASIWGVWAFGGLAAAILPMAAVGLLFAGAISRGRFDRVTPDEREAARTIGRPTGQLAVASYALGYGDRFVVQAILGPIPVAIYTLGYQLGEGAMDLVTAPVTAAATPKIVGLWQAGEAGRAEAEGIGRRLGLAILGLAIAAPAVVYLMEPTGILDIVSKDHRFPAVVAIIGAAVGLQGITRIGYALLLAQGRTRTALHNFVAVGLLSAVVAPLLTWQWGLVGTAWATLIGYGSLAVATVRSVRTAVPAPAAVEVTG